MIRRYENPAIAEIWCDEHKVGLWQKTEMAVIQSRVELGRIGQDVFQQINSILLATPIDLEWWRKEDRRIHHDLNAFVYERQRHLPPELQQQFHKGITSYDTEEPAFSKMLQESLDVVCFGDSALEMAGIESLEAAMVSLAREHRHTIMMGRTHGQEAELQTFGAEVISWIAQLRQSVATLQSSAKNLQYCKLSGTIGNYIGVDPELERKALEILGFIPFYGATQILPREIHAPVAQALCQVVLTLDKISRDIRLAARSGRPILHEPFEKVQTGSSSMPHKKNTIRTEQVEGLGRMAQGYLQMIISNIPTWEKRAIEQSCVERVAWPDLFHTAMQGIKQVHTVISRLEVYTDMMLQEIQEIVETRGCYAASTAKDWLRDRLAPYGIGSEEAARIVQLAAFLVHDPVPERMRLRNARSTSLEDADHALEEFFLLRPNHETAESIQNLISEARLQTSVQLAASNEQVERWNEILREIFDKPQAVEEWNSLSQPSLLLANEQVLYREVLGD